MTQEVFYYYAQHFVCSLPENHGATILFLDGHASCWSVPALQYLLKNHVYPFILASHTSIWSQPNDGGVNKWFHRTIEESCSEVRCGYDAATIRYFNGNFRKGWHKFLEAERLDLIATGLNNATNAFQQTALYPCNPNCKSWSGTINTLGLGNNNTKGQVQYEIYPTLPQKQLSQWKKSFLMAWTLILMTIKHG